MKYKHIFFDLDNTLWDFEANSKITLKRLYSDYHVFEIYGVEFEVFFQLYSKINNHFWDLYRLNKVSKEDLKSNRFFQAFEELGIHNKTIPDEFRIKYIANLTKNSFLIDGAVELLKYLKEKDYQIHIITNGFVDASKRKVGNSMLRKYIQTIISSDDVGVRKPDPIIFEHALKLTQAKVEESIFIGDDWEADIIGSKNMNMDVIYFNFHANKANDGSVKEVSKLLEIKEVL